MLERLSLMTFTLDIDVAMKKMNVEQVLTLAKNENIPFVDVSNLTAKSLQEYTNAIKKTKVRPLCYIGTISFFSNREPYIIKMLNKHMDNAVKLGARLFMIVPINAQKDEKKCTKLGKEGAREILKKYFIEAISMASGKGLRVCFETTPQDYSCLSGIEDCQWLLEHVQDLGLVFDTANMLAHGDTPMNYYEALKKYIVHVHLKNIMLAELTYRDRLFHAELTKNGKVMKCCVFDQGVIPLKDIILHMEQDGYQGTYAIEYGHPEKYPADFKTNELHLRRHMTFCKDCRIG